jgi:hypothetical protein
MTQKKWRRLVADRRHTQAARRAAKRNAVIVEVAAQEYVPWWRRALGGLAARIPAFG